MTKRQQTRRDGNGGKSGDETAKAKPPFHPYLVLAIAILLPAVGQIFNGDSKRAFMFAFSILSLGWISYHLTTPEHSFLGRYAGGIFVYCVSVLDAYRIARLRWEMWHKQQREREAGPSPDRG
ncbi:MAG: hypothetical protein ACOY3L_13750 [Pseudomonadota bacterium]